MSLGHFDRAHLNQAHGDAAARELVGCLAACESRSDDGYFDITHLRLRREPDR